MTRVIDPNYWWVLLGWVLGTAAAVIGTTMVVVGMIEEVPDIVRGTLQRTMKRRRRS
jgi:hypothetical protein